MKTNCNNRNRETVVAAFHTHEEAQAAVRELKDAGFTDDQIGIVSQDTDGTYRETEEGNMAAEGAMTGAAAGLGTGALWGLGIVAGVLPAVGPVIAGGALAAVAASAATTAAAGGLIGALVGLGIPEEEAEYYEGEFQKGRTIVTVKASDGQCDRICNILDRYDAYDYDRRDQAFAADASCSERLNMDGKLVARREVLNVEKDEQNEEQVAVRKEVSTETKQVEVPIKREELVVERTDLDDECCDPIRDTSTEEERITLRQEEVDIDKRTVAKEAVEVGKREVHDTREVEAELKEEHIVVDRETAGSR